MAETESGDIRLTTPVIKVERNEPDVFDIASKLAHLVHFMAEVDRLSSEISQYPDKIGVLAELGETELHEVLEIGNNRRLGGVPFIGSKHEVQIKEIIAQDYSI